MQHNTHHGLPLTRADRKAAAQRILDIHPHWSDRAIAKVTGLSPKPWPAFAPGPTPQRPDPDSAGRTVGPDRSTTDQATAAPVTTWPATPRLLPTMSHTRVADAGQVLRALGDVHNQGRPAVRLQHCPL